MWTPSTVYSSPSEPVLQAPNLHSLPGRPGLHPLAMSLLVQWIQQAFPPSPTWHPADMPDLAGKVVLVTGGNAGIGREIVKELLQKNAKVYMACRSQEKGEEAIKDLKSATGKHDIHFLKLDLADLKSVYEAAQDYQKYVALR